MKPTRTKADWQALRQAIPHQPTYTPPPCFPWLLAISLAFIGAGVIYWMAVKS